MRLHYVNLKNLTLGRLVLLLGDSPGSEEPRLRIVDRREKSLILLRPASILLDDDDLTEVIPLAEILQKLRIPEFEPGDRVVLRGRPGAISQAVLNDLHVHVRLDEQPDKEIYTNLIHLDFSPTLRTVERLPALRSVGQNK